MNRTRTAIERAEIPSYISLTGRSTDSLVWLINANGELIYNTGIPATTYTKLQEAIDDRQFYRLPFAAQNRSQIVYSQIARNSELGKLLPRDNSWMIASAPLTSLTGAYAGEIILLRALSADSRIEFFQDNLVPISFLIAFFLALIVILLLSREITKPISLLADTAERVYRGDPLPECPFRHPVYPTIRKTIYCLLTVKSFKMMI